MAIGLIQLDLLRHMDYLQILIVLVVLLEKNNQSMVVLIIEMQVPFSLAT